MTSMAELKPQHFLWQVDDGIATVRLESPRAQEPADVRQLRRAARHVSGTCRMPTTSTSWSSRPNGGNFCSGGDVHEIIGPLVGMDMKQLLAFTRMTGDLVKAMIGCGKPIIAAVDGVCVGAGAIIAMASDLRLATPEATTAFLFTRVGLAGCDMGACAMLPRIIGQGRAAELLYTGRSMSARRGRALGLLQRAAPGGRARTSAPLALATAVGRRAHLRPRHHQDAVEPGVEHGTRTGDRGRGAGQAICMQTADFERAYRAFVAHEKPVFEGD